MKFPLLFTYTGTTLGDGFVATVEMRGRAVAEVEVTGAWIYGVQPGGIAEGGRTLDDAHRHFRETLRLVLVDFVTEARAFDAFKDEAERFFNTQNGPKAEEWTAGVERVREGKVAGIAMAGLPKWPAESETFIKVTKAEPRSEMNEIKSETAVADPCADGEAA